jgi:transcriptional regulator with GAF, ATPase, and Fis domain
VSHQRTHSETTAGTLAGLCTPPDGAVRPAATLTVAYAGGSLDGVRKRIVRAQGLLLGRNEPLLADDPRVSRRHAEIVLDRLRWLVQDLGSRNGTRVNGRLLDKPHPLAAGDLIQIGSTFVVFSPGEPRLHVSPVDPELVGESDAMAALREAIDLVAERDNSVLITGETGVGKEVVARALHRRSGRPGAFVAINCGGLSEGVLESELFGHARGAFTGAVSSRDGLFRAAEKGTLFLDELGEMPAPLQVKLLRALETRTVRPMGTAHEIPVNVRVVAATNRDVLAQVREGSFRSDLYARLGQWPIHVPPLRERREDIPLLARHLMARAGAGDRPVEPALAEALLLHDWRLNVRGLGNVLSIAAITAGDKPLRLHPQVQAALAADRALTVPPPAEPAAPERSTEPPPEPALPTVQELRAALERFHGNVAKAARHLGCSRQQLYRWLVSHELDAASFRRAPEGAD